VRNVPPTANHQATGAIGGDRFRQTTNSVVLHRLSAAVRASISRLLFAMSISSRFSSDLLPGETSLRLMSRAARGEAAAVGCRRRKRQAGDWKKHSTKPNAGISLERVVIRNKANLVPAGT